MKSRTPKVLHALCGRTLLGHALAAAGVEARYFELDSDLGHSSTGAEHAKWSPALRDFLAPLIAKVA